MKLPFRQGNTGTLETLRRYTYKARVRPKCENCSHRERVHIPYPVDYELYAFTCTRCAKINFRETKGRGFNLEKTESFFDSFKFRQK